MAGVKTIRDANAFLKKFIVKFNKQFALEPNFTNSVFEKVDKEKNYTLAVLSERKIDNGHCIKYKNNYYKLLDKNGYQKCFKKGTEIVVAKTLDNSLYANINGNLFILEVVPEHERISKRIDSELKHKENRKPKKHYIPPQEHPWKKASFDRYLRKKKISFA